LGDNYNKLRASNGTVSSTRFDIIRSDLYRLQSLRDAVIGCGSGGENLTENSYVADTTVAATITSYDLYYPNNYIRRIILTNNTASSMTFNQISFAKNISAQASSESGLVTKTFYFGFIVFDETVTLQSNESISVLVGFD